MKRDDISRYADMLQMPAHRSPNRKHMSNYDRAAQFAPFAALRGYDDEIGDASRIRTVWTEPDENETAELAYRFHILKNACAEMPEVTVRWFREEAEDGRWITKQVQVRRIDEVNRLLVTADRETIPMDYIVSLEGEIFRGMHDE